MGDRERGAGRSGAQHPERGRGHAERVGLDPVERRVGGGAALEVGLQVAELAPEVGLGQRVLVAIDERPRRRAPDHPRTAGDAEVDATGEQRLEREEDLGDLDRAVVREQDRARADPQAAGALADQRDQHLWTRVRGVGRVVLGDPEAPVPQLVGELGELERFPQHLVGREALVRACSDRARPGGAAR